MMNLTELLVDAGDEIVAVHGDPDETHFTLFTKMGCVLMLQYQGGHFKCTEMPVRMSD